MPITTLKEQNFPKWCELHYYEIIKLNSNDSQVFERKEKREKIIICSGNARLTFLDNGVQSMNVSDKANVDNKVADKGLNPEIKTHLAIDIKNGIHCTTGSLGHGLPIATGMAFARKKQKIKGKIFVMISDGECQEGTTWESLLIATKHKLDNLVIIVDRNGLQITGKTEEVNPIEPLMDKFFSCLK